jgi:hypothetical protein
MPRLSPGYGWPRYLGRLLLIPVGWFVSVIWVDPALPVIPAVALFLIITWAARPWTSGRNPNGSEPLM